MKQLDQYLIAIYSDSFHPAVMTETLATFPEPKIPTIPDDLIKIPKKYAEMTCPEKNNTDKSILQNISKKDVYKLDMHKIYNLVIGQTNEQSQEKAALDATFKAVNTDQYPIGYLMIL